MQGSMGDIKERGEEKRYNMGTVSCDCGIN